jgi:hypothetical protein
MDEDIIVAHIGIVGFRIVSVLLGKTVITFNTGTEFFESPIES